MREIKFRGKRIDNGKWAQGYLFKIWEGTYILWGTTNDVPNMVEVLPETIGQFTGLKDKNDVEIYEGDILRIKTFDSSDMQVKFIDGAFCLCSVETGFYLADIHYTHHAGQKQSVVIGNIHDNPKLKEAP